MAATGLAVRTPRSTSRRHRGTWLVAAAMVAALGTGAWGVGQLQTHVVGAPVGPDEAVSLPGGLLRIDEVIPDHMSSHQLMPNGMMPDVVPDGMQRIHLHVSLQATSGDGLAYDGDDLTLEGDRMAPVAPHTVQLGPGVAPEGSTVAGRVTFDLPENASDLVLVHEDGRRGIALDPPPAPAGGHDH